MAAARYKPQVQTSGINRKRYYTIATKNGPFRDKLMHRAQDRANPTRPPASILCTGHRIHEFRLGYSIPSYAQGTGFTTTCVNPMHRAQDSRVPPRSPPSILYTGHRIHDTRVSYAQGTYEDARRGATVPAPRASSVIPKPDAVLGAGAQLCRRGAHAQ